MKNDTIINQLNDGSIKFFFNTSGNLTIKSRADFFRVTKFDQNLGYVGNIVDYYTNGDTAFSVECVKGEFEGEVKKYYPNGKINYHGFFKKSLKDSTWRHYFNNGQLDKIIEYKNETGFLKEAYKKNGKILVQNGNGKYKGTLVPNTQMGVKYHISGEIKEGKMNGKWIWSGSRRSGKEYFNKGEFLISKSDLGFVDQTNLITLTDFDFHEALVLFRFFSTPQTLSTINSRHISAIKLGSPNDMLKYNSDVNLNQTLVVELKKFIHLSDEKSELSNFWGFVQLSISAESEVSDIKVITNNKNAEETLTGFFSSLKDFETTKVNNEPTKCYIYLSLLYHNGQLYIPNYSSSYF